MGKAGFVPQDIDDYNCEWPHALSPSTTVLIFESS